MHETSPRYVFVQMPSSPIALLGQQWKVNKSIDVIFKYSMNKYYSENRVLCAKCIERTIKLWVWSRMMISTEVNIYFLGVKYYHGFDLMMNCKHERYEQ